MNLPPSSALLLVLAMDAAVLKHSLNFFFTPLSTKNNSPRSNPHIRGEKTSPSNQLLPASLHVLLATVRLLCALPAT